MWAAAPFLSDAAAASNSAASPDSAAASPDSAVRLDRAAAIGIDAVAAEWLKSTARLIELEREQKRGGMVTRVWKIPCRDARLSAIERDAADGRLVEFMVTKRDD
jgi:hypothetical protein